MGTDSVLLYQTQCPECASKGKDTSKDNLGVYSDGHVYCFACRHYRDASLEKKLMPVKVKTETKEIALPFDASINFPEEVLSRLSAWGITPADIVNHHFKWSESRKVLVMPVYSIDGTLLMYQERSWDIGAKKYLTYGSPSDILHIIRPIGVPEDNSVIIITEDLVSAIKVSKYKPAMPIWGSDIPLKTITRLAARFSVVGVWLDPDMKLKAVKDVLRISQYVPAFFIDSTLDPKFYELERIKEHIDIAGYKLLYKDEPAKVTDYPKKPQSALKSECQADPYFECPGYGKGCCMEAEWEKELLDKDDKKE